MKNWTLMIMVTLAISGCITDAPQPYCMEWEHRRAPESEVPTSVMPRSARESELANPCEFLKEEAEAKAALEEKMAAEAAQQP